MCYDATALLKRIEKLEKRYAQLGINVSPNTLKFNQSAFAKGAELPVISYQDPHTVQSMGWGFQPKAKTDNDRIKFARYTPNCRADTLAQKVASKQWSMFTPLLNSPVVILLDGFKEWHTLKDDSKYPYFIKMKDDETFAVAGLMTSYRPVENPHEEKLGFTLHTVGANNLVGWIHNKPKNSQDLRMPAILEPEQIVDWLDTSLPAIERLQMLKPFDDSQMCAHSIVNFKKRATALGEVEASIAPFNYENKEVPMVLDGNDLA